MDDGRIWALVAVAAAAGIAATQSGTRAVRLSDPRLSKPVGPVDGLDTLVLQVHFETDGSGRSKASWEEKRTLLKWIQNYLEMKPEIRGYNAIGDGILEASIVLDFFIDRVPGPRWTPIDATTEAWSRKIGSFLMTGPRKGRWSSFQVSRRTDGSKAVRLADPRLSKQAPRRRLLSSGWSEDAPAEKKLTRRLMKTDRPFNISADMIDVSLAHLTKTDAEWLRDHVRGHTREGEADAILGGPVGDGWIIWNDDDFPFEQETSKTMAAILDWARQHGYYWIHFSEAEQHSSYFPTFSWDIWL